MNNRLRDDVFLPASEGIYDGVHGGTPSSSFRIKGDRDTLIEIEASFDPGGARFPPGEWDTLRAQRVLRSLPVGERRRLRNLADSVTLGVPMSEDLYLERLASAIQKAALLWGTDEDSLADAICSEQTSVGLLMLRSADP